MRKLKGKIIGGLLGFAFGGPVGGVMGVLLGHMHDQETIVTSISNNGLGRKTFYGRQGTALDQHMTCVIVLGAKVAKADGRVSRSEIDTFKRVFKITPVQEREVGRVFDQARRNPHGFEVYAFQLSRMYEHDRRRLEDILKCLFLIAAADYAILTPPEITFLKRVAFIFSFDGDDFSRIAAMAGVKLTNPSSGNAQGPAIDTTLRDAYALFGLVETSSPEAIKKAYRTMIRAHHPDKLIAEGLAPELIASANEKMKRINSAYDCICRARGIK